MASYLNVYQGNCVETFELEGKSSFRIGNSQNADVVIHGELSGGEILLSNNSGAWHAECAGNVFYKQQKVVSHNLVTGDALILNSTARIAVEYYNTSDFEKISLNLNKDEILIGRSKSADIILSYPNVSSKHCKIYKRGNCLVVEDLSSTDGTYVNGQRITECVLQAHDVLQVGLCFISIDNNILNVQFQKGYGKLSANIKNAPQTGGYNHSVEEYPYFKLSPRIHNIIQAGKVFEIEVAPTIGNKPEINWLNVLLPSILTFLVMGVIGIVTGMIAMIFYSGPMMLIGVVMAVVNYRSQTKGFQNKESLRQEKYGEYLQQIEKGLSDYNTAQRAQIVADNGTPEECVRKISTLDATLWNRNAYDSDFMNLRVGCGTISSAAEIKIPKVGVVLQKDTYTDEPQRIRDKYLLIENVPVCYEARKYPRCGIVGNHSNTEDMLRAIIVQACTHHTYDELKLVVFYPKSEHAEWDWVRWLPHTFDDAREFRYLACEKYDADEIIKRVEKVIHERITESKDTIDSNSRVSQTPHYLIVVVDERLVSGTNFLKNAFSCGENDGITIVMQSESIVKLPSAIDYIIELGDSEGRMYSGSNSLQKQSFVPDHCGVALCRQTAKAMAPIRIPAGDVDLSLPDCVTFLEGYGVKRPDELDVLENWENACAYQSLAVPIGMASSDHVFNFDISEKAYGPHGLVAGTTGSGKSEMVQSWLLSMATQFSPQDVSFVLIDFKGTGLILPFRNLPHIAGTISDLDTNIQRNLIALRSELERRKAVLDKAGVNNIVDYLKKYKKWLAAEPLSYLIVVIDEYAEFKSKFPDFTAEINSLFRTGRSLGVHIVLMTQNPAGIVSGQAEDNVHFRWCLKVQSKEASKDFIGVADAAGIHNPGRAFIKVGSDELFAQVQSFWSGAKYQPDARDKHAQNLKIARVKLNGQKEVFQETDTVRGENGKEIDAVVRYIAETAKKNGIASARRIWQDRMPATIYLPDILRTYMNDSTDRLAPIVGMVDDPNIQAQYPLRVPLSQYGPFVLYGAPSTGKTTFLQTLLMALCLQYTPDEVNTYVWDFGSWTLGMFKDYPQIGGVALSNESDKILKIAELVEAELEERKRKFSRIGVGSLDAYCQVTGEKLPSVVLVIDNYGPLPTMFPTLDVFINNLISMGSNYGIYFVATCNALNALGYKLSNYIKSAYTLQLVEKSDYASVVGKTDGLVPENSVGRGLAKLERVVEFQTALPVKVDSDAARTKMIRENGLRAASAWQGKKAKGIVVLPDEVFAEDYYSGKDIFLGLNTQDAQPVTLPFTKHYITVLGNQPYGIDQMLDLIVHQATNLQNARVVILDSDARSLSAYKGTTEYYTNAEDLTACLRATRNEMKLRQGEYREGKTDFDPIFFIIRDWSTTYLNISDEGAQEIELYIRAAAGLGVYMIFGCEVKGYCSLHNRGESITNVLSKASAVFMDGIPQDYAVFNTKKMARGEEIKKGEACLLNQDTPIYFKIARR